MEGYIFMRIFLLSTVLLVTVMSLSAQSARVQFIHNSSDVSLKYVDIYWNGTLLYNNFVFHRASPFINRVGGVLGVISIADSSSSSASEAFSTLEFMPMIDEAYIIIFQGMRDEAGYSSHQPFSMKLIEDAKEYSSDYASVDMLFVNSSTDAGVFSINETWLLQVPFVQGLSYGEHQDYFTMFAADYQFRIVETAQQQNIGDFSAPLSQYGLSSKAVTIVMSGFSNPAANHDGQLIGLWMAKPEGGMMIEFASSFTSVSLIHSSSDVSLQEVDVYWNNQKIIENLPFRNSSSVIKRRFVGGNNVLGIALSDSESSDDIFYTHSYQSQPSDTARFVLSGLRSAGGYSHFRPLALSPIPTTTYTLGSNELELKVMNTITDLPDFHLTGIEENLETPIVFREWISIIVATENQEWTMRNVVSTYEFAAFEASFENVNSPSAVILASGFLHPDQNNIGAEYGLWMALEEGGAMIELAKREENYIPIRFLNNSSDAMAHEVDIYINEELRLSSLSFSSSVLEVKTGADVEIKILQSGGGFLGSELYSETFNFHGDNSYLLILDGVASPTGYNPIPPFKVTEINNFRQASQESGFVDILFYHGSTDTGSLLFSNSETEQEFVPQLSFGDHSLDYVALSSFENFTINISSTTGYLFGNYDFPSLSSGLEGEAVLVLTHGFMNPPNNSNGAALSAWMMRSDGSLHPLEKRFVSQLSELSPPYRALLFPNPADRYVGVMKDGKLMDENDFFSIRDTVGRVVLKSQTTGYFIDISALSVGFYILQIGEISLPFQVYR